MEQNETKELPMTKFWTQYKSISQKLPKPPIAAGTASNAATVASTTLRNLPPIITRKANLHELKLQLSQLIAALKSDHENIYTAFTYVALARCEQALGASESEAGYYLSSGLHFWEQEAEIKSTASISLVEENMNQAIQFYELAIEIYKKCNHRALAASLYFEMGVFLYLLFEKFHEAVQCFNRAITFFASFSLLSTLSCYDFILKSHLSCFEYKSAVFALRKKLDLLTSSFALESYSKSFIESKIKSNKVTIFLLYLLQRQFVEAKEWLETEFPLEEGEEFAWPLTRNAVLHQAWDMARVRDEEGFKELRSKLTSGRVVLSKIQWRLFMLLFYEETCKPEKA